MTSELTAIIVKLTHLVNHKIDNGYKILKILKRQESNKVSEEQDN